jgi:hypothetical protein
MLMNIAATKTTLTATFCGYEAPSNNGTTCEDISPG